MWMSEKFGNKIDFNIDKTIANLKSIRGKIELNSSGNRVLTEVALLKQDRQKYLQVLPLNQAIKVIDYVWDNAFNHFTNK